jgi:DNA primase
VISPRSIEDVLQAAKIEDVVGEFVNLKRRGANLIGLCPFHQEKTPSFNVSPSRNIYKCFGCGKGGDPANFLMEHESLSFPEAIRWLAERYQIELEETQLSDEAREQQKHL